MNNYFQGTKDSPYHISIGGVVRNNEGKICCHYFESFAHPQFGVLEDFYLLMRETIEPHQTIEICLARGLMEEFGIEAKINSYIGSIVAMFPKDGVMVEKTTLYFLCDLVSCDESKRAIGDMEATSVIEWLDIKILSEKMKEQAKRLQRADIDESVILERLP